MLTTHTRIENLPILSLQTGAPLGYAVKPIIDPREFRVVAFYCEGPRIQGKTILHVDDIREVSNMGLIVDSSDNLMPPDGLVRLQEIIDTGFTLIGKPVVTTKKQKLGKVEGYSLDLDSFFIMKINVHQPLMRSFLSGNLLIDRTQITTITDSLITVEANEVKEQTRTNQATTILENPFRKHETQPNLSSVDER